MNLPKEILINLDNLTELCARFKVVRLFIFGSSTNGKFLPESSDVDFLVEMEKLPPVQHGENLMQFWSALESLFERKVDLLTRDSVKNPYLLREMEQSKVLLYDRSGEKIPT